MARVPIPQQGQPLDLAYISTLANAVNQLSEEGAALAQGNNFILAGRVSDTKSSHKLYGAQVFAQEIIITSGEPQTVAFSPNNFASPPIVTATLVDPSNTKANVVVKNITSGSVQVVVDFPDTEKNSTKVSLIAIGLPSSVS